MRAGLAALAALALLTALASAQPPAYPPAVAIVYVVEGEVVKQIQGAEPERLGFAALLAEGDRLELAAGARLAVAFATGRRFELSGPAQALTLADGMTAPEGQIAELAAVPPLPPLPPIALAEQPSRRSAAVVVRGERIGGLDPADGEKVLADATVLRFLPVDGAARYQVEVEDTRGIVIFRVDTQASQVSIPAGVLKPGASYCWTVATLDRPGPTARGMAGFVTLSKEVTEARERLRQAVEGLGDAGSRALLDAVDHGLGLTTRSAPRSLAEARALDEMGVTTAKSGDYAAAEPLLRQALAIREELAPATTEVAASLNHLGILARRRGDLAAADGYLTRGEELLRRLAPYSAAHAKLLQSLGNLAADRGELDRAEGFHRRALLIFERTAPGGDSVAVSFSNLAGVLMQRGDLAAAEDLSRRSLALQERLAPDALGVANTLILLGHIASRRGDPAAAEGYYRRALEIQERVSPGAPDVFSSLESLGILAALQGDYPKARAYLSRSLVIAEKLAPQGLEVAICLEALGRLEVDSGGDLARAEELLERSLRIFENAAPESLEVGEVRHDLGEVATRRGDFAAAIAHHGRALELQHKLAPESAGEAEALFLLGRVERRAGRHEEGTRNLCRAIDVLDRQRGRIGGTQEAKSAFEATLADHYFACLEGWLDRGRPAEAFKTLERGRARTFLDLLADRDVRLSGLPLELVIERRHLDAEYDQAQLQLGRLDPVEDGAEIERLTAKLRDLRAGQAEITARMRRESPRAAAVASPEPLELTGARAALDPGSVLLEYAVGAERSWLFVVEPAATGGTGLSVFPLAVGAQALRAEVASFRRLLQRSGSETTALEARARRLYDLLVRPAEALVAGARRIVVSADGPLHTLPFAALRSADRALAEGKPIHSVLSATVYAELVRLRPAQGERRGEHLAAFGDPVYPALTPELPADSEVREAVRRGLSLAPLPASRAEVTSIATLYPRSEIFLGAEAREEKAKAVGPEARLLHFAVHGLLDERMPINSGLALSLPEHPSAGQENGLLQAWEIFETLHLDADLVTLSACDTALGKEMGGEGLLGLTRAFQHAGARSVLASLWSVADDSTAVLMKHFYTHLAAGESKDEALRAAQLRMIRSGDPKLAHPSAWAGFQLYGDWR